MKKVLLTFLAVFMAVPAFAIEVYNNGDNSVAIYGHIRGYLGYGMGTTSSESYENGVTTKIDPVYDHNMLYGLQGNTRIGTNIKIGNFSGQIELGANEKTLQTQNTKDVVGFRQAWGAYTFGNGSKLLFGKTDTPTAMGGFNSDIYNTDGGLKGFGGTVTGSRRFQIQYSIAGLTLALIEDDMADVNYKEIKDETGKVTGTTGIWGFNDNAPYTPRAAISYTFKNDSLLVKLAATYTAVNGFYCTDKQGNITDSCLDNKKNWTNLHAGGVTLGVKPQFGNMWVGFVARYGANEEQYGESQTLAGNGTFGHQEIKTFASMSDKNDGSFNNIHRVGAALEFGMKATENFTAILGAGYQATIPELNEKINLKSESLVYHSYAVYLQGQYAFSPNFALVPQIAWYDTVRSYNYEPKQGTKYEDTGSYGGLLVGAQFRVTF